MRFAAIVLLICALGCDQQPPAPAAPEPKSVLAKVYPVAQIAQEIGGKRVKAEWFIEGGQPLVEIEQTPQRRNMARVADLVISRGGSEEWMRGAENQAAQAHRSIRLEKLPSAAGASPGGGIWLDPSVARELAGEIAKRLSIIDPGGAKLFDENLVKFQRELDAITEDAATQIARARQRKVLCSSELFTPLFNRFGVQQAMPAVEASEELSAERIREIRETARAIGSAALLVPSDLPQGVIRDLSDKVGLPVLTLDPVGTSAPAGRDTYLELLRYNCDQLIAGLGLKTSS